MMSAAQLQTSAILPCKKQLKYGLCQNRKCLAPKPCPHMDIDHSEYIDLLRKLRKIKGVKKVFGPLGHPLRLRNR